MNNENVTIHLNTPLVVHLGGSGQPVVNQSSLIRGKVLSETNGGLFIQVKAIGNAKGWSENLPFKKVFLPHHKIDFVAVES